ncbi:MAG: patatin-like phospholipase family protein [Eubacteriales bacterium]|nr:patatin-like phospholipase family protein [Eubacteriales bacterium]
MEIRKTALVLGGGGSRGAYEIGVWQALRELGIPIHIVTGSSVGAINGALIAQDAFDLSVQLWKEIETPMIFDVDIKDILSNNGIGSDKLKKLLRQYIDETAVRESSVEYGLVTAELPAMTPKFFMKEEIPKGMLVEYILASSTLFPAMKSHEINSSKYVDGGYTDNLPVGLALDHGATHVVAVDLEVPGIIRKNRLDDADYLRIIQCPWDLGNFLIFDKNNSRKIMRLGYLDTLKAYQVYDGSFFCFVRGEFDKRSMQGANMAGIIFALDPGLIYKKYIYNNHLKKAVDSHIKAIGKDLQTDSNTLKGIIQESILKAKAALNQKTITLIIARSLKEVGDTKNIFLTKPVMKLLRDEILAANYLVRESLL